MPPLYDTARSYEGRPVEIGDVDGNSYQGILEYSTTNGVYLYTGNSGIFFPFLAIASIVLLSSLFFF